MTPAEHCMTRLMDALRPLLADPARITDADISAVTRLAYETHDAIKAAGADTATTVIRATRARTARNQER
jgi:hypothetical protein